MGVAGAGYAVLSGLGVPTARPPVALASPGSGSALWYLSRGTGVVSLILLTIVMVLGVLGRRGAQPGAVQAFVFVTLHRNASILVMVLLAVHVVSAVLDPYAPIRLIDAVIPFVSAYRPVWLGFGALAFDLLIALVATSLLRTRLGVRRWRAVHWSAYVAWPVAAVHGLGTGTDTSSGWALLITGGCVIAVVVSVVVRARMISDRLPGRSAAITGAAVFAPLVLVGWLLIGPLAPGWAARSGTPGKLLTGSGAAGTVSGAPPSPPSAAASGSSLPHGTASWTGRISQQDNGGGQVALVLTGPLTGGPAGRLEIQLVGTPAAGGGVALASGAVALAPSAGGSWTGPVSGLDNGRITATLQASGRTGSVPMRVTVQVDQASGGLSGTAVFG
jgi:methionine sulfoxide reductase heme-binding subunit